MIPSTINIGGRDINVVIVENSDQLHVDDSSSNWGMSKGDEDSIYIKKLKSESQMEEVLCHEIKHFLDYSCGRKSYLLHAEKIDYELQNLMSDNVFWLFLKHNTNFFEERK